MADFSKRCEILGELWFSYRDDENFQDFVEYNDVGLPLAYLVSEGLAKAEPQGENYIHETWDLLLAALSVDPDQEYDDLDHMLSSAGNAEGNQE